MKYYTIVDKSVPRTFSHSGGYVRLYKPDHLDNQRGYIYEHRYIMELKIGRRLTKQDVIHHKNKNKRDNRPENLQLHTPSTHSIHHLKEFRKRIISKRRCNKCRSSDTYIFDNRAFWCRNPFNKSEWLCRSCYLKITKYEAGGNLRYILTLGHGIRSHK